MFFQKYENLLKDIGTDLTPFEITGSLNMALADFYTKENSLELITKSAETFQLFCMNEMVLKSFTG